MFEMLPIASTSGSSAKQLPVILLEDEENDFVCADFLPVTTVFGGFRTWPCSKSDFVLIAECSEISGPNPIFTIPPRQHLVKNLNALCVRLLSTDYQEFGSNKDVPMVDAQVLLPDIMMDVHAAVNHFTLYDAEARGFVRPFCLAYVTADKHKLLQVSDAIFKSLAEASSFVQHSNRKFCVNGLEKLMLDLELTKSTLASHSNLQNKCDNPAERLKVYNRLIESCMKDIQNILSLVKSTKGVEEVDLVIEDLVQRLNLKFGPSKLIAQIDNSEDITTYKPKQLKIPLQQNFDKHLKNLYYISPGGMLLSVYHLNQIHKHFRRKYANIASCTSYNPRNETSKDSCMFFGACMRINSVSEDSVCNPKCCIALPMSWKLHRFSDSKYFDNFSPQSIAILSNFLTNQNVFSNMDSRILAGNDDGYGSYKSNVSSNDFSIATCNGIGDHVFKEYESNEQNHCDASHCSNHVVPLNEIWDIIDHLRKDFPEIENFILEILQLINQSESLLYSLLTRNLVVILFSMEEELFAKSLLRVLATIMPRNPHETIAVEHDRRNPLLSQDLKHIAAVSYRLPCEISHLVPKNAKSSIVVLNLAESKYQGPRYTGYLLQNLNSSVKNLSVKDPILPFLISIISDIDLQLNLWKEINSSSASSVSAVYLLQKEFTRCDIRIIETLSNICEKPSDTT